MSQTLADLTEKALAVRDHYHELQLQSGQKKWNAQDRMAGFVGDVGDLSKLIMAKYQLRTVPGDVDAALAHELSDCLWSVIVLADELGIDLEQSFIKMTNDLHERIEKEKTKV